MDRRRFLSSVPLALALAPAGTVGAVETGGTVRWHDVTLLDGRVLPASRLEGATVVVEFWASWCPFCARQNPELEALHRATAGRLEVLTFSIDKDAAKARAYVAEHGYTFAAAMADPATLAQFDLRRGLPVLFVVDPTGRVVQRESGEMFPEDVRALARYARR